MYRAKILSIRRATAKESQKPYFIVVTAEKNHWVHMNTFRNVAQTDNIDLFVGGTVTAEYHRKGDELLDGSICTADDIILKEVFLEKNPDIVAKIGVEELNRQTVMMDDMKLLLQRKREENQAKLKAKLQAVSQETEPTSLPVVTPQILPNAA